MEHEQETERLEPEAEDLEPETANDFRRGAERGKAAPVAAENG
jgi:hypothetical protein